MYLSNNTLLRRAPATLLFVVILSLSSLTTGCLKQPPLGENKALRTYVEFADGLHRGIYDPETRSDGYPDEPYDATTAMVVNWHRQPETDSNIDARLRYRQVYPVVSSWETVQGESFEFWHREERINRVVLKKLNPNCIYEYQLQENGKRFRFRTMPASLDERPVKIVMTSDHQTPSWSQVARNNAKITALQKPDMFIVAGDFVNGEGQITPESSNKWATYLDTLYGIDDGYFFYDIEIDGQIYENVVIPHVSVPGNHETGEEHHLRWPADLYAPQPYYPKFIAANWMELLFHWPYKSEGFYSEFHPAHQNIDPDHVREGFGHGGFGALSFSDYLLLIGLDNSQNWAGEPEIGLRDHEGNLITERWPWFETHHAEVRQDLWLKSLLEPGDGPSARELYAHIIPFWHRGLFGTVRQNMTYKNRPLLKYWLPILARNGVKFIKEGHDHNFTRTVPLEISSEPPELTYLAETPYQPPAWELSDNLSREYKNDFYTVNTIHNEKTESIIGWEYDGNYITGSSNGFIVVGHGGWAASRREPGQRGGGNAGLWFVDPRKGGTTFGGEASFHTTTLHLTKDNLTVEAFHPGQLENFENRTDPIPIHRFRWDLNREVWEFFDIEGNTWISYKNLNK